nr:MAG TPA: hypothetical protein [Caudoviricetes sp.]
MQLLGRNLITLCGERMSEGEFVYILIHWYEE